MGRAPGFAAGHRLIGVVEAPEQSTWVTCWKMDGTLFRGSGSPGDLVDVPADIEQQLAPRLGKRPVGDDKPNGTCSACGGPLNEHLMSTAIARDGSA